MMANAVVEFIYTSVPGFAAGTVAANVVTVITGSAVGNTTPQTQSVANGATLVTFASVAADTYAYTITNTDASGTTLGTIVSGSFTITAPSTISLSLVTAATVTQA
jgi:hypothetical protein